jgi:hypothetical protein
MAIPAVARILLIHELGIMGRSAEIATEVGRPKGVMAR